MALRGRGIFERGLYKMKGDLKFKIWFAKIIPSFIFFKSQTTRGLEGGLAEVVNMRKEWC